MEPLAKNENDHLGFFLDKSIRAITKDETIFFSDKLIKVNRYGMNQERNILITNKAIYNLKKKTLKRRIEIGWTRGITVSKITDEFVVHGSDAEYDYNFISPKKKKIIEFISKSFFELAKKELALCELESKSLKNVVTSKKEKKKDANFSRMPETFLIPVYNYLYGTKDDNLVLNKKSATVVRNDTFYSKRKEIKEVKLEEFKILKLLGRGTFGKVCLVEYIPTGELYAMKSLKKSVLLDQEQIENTLLEKKILESLEHPFLIEMMFYFSTQERIYFVMPFMRGGELFQHLRRFKIFSEEKVRFYAAQVLLAIEHLHQFGIVYRDIKPENILMDEEGYLKLTDFGMSKHLKGDEKAMSFCGTPEYLAPEIIIGSGHDKTVDFWSLGILMYEMLCGLPPYYNENLDRMYELIRLAELRFPKKTSLSNEAKDLITKLLDKNPKTRLGAKNGISEIKTHSFFATIDFELVFKKKLNPPFAPELKDKYDIQNFDDEFTSEVLVQSVIADKTLELVNNNQEKFKDFETVKK